MFPDQKKRKPRSDKGKRRKKHNPAIDITIQVRLNGNTVERDTSAIQAWFGLIDHYSGDKREAMRETLIDAWQRIKEGWTPAPLAVTLSADMLTMLQQAMTVMTRLSAMDFSAVGQTGEETVQQFAELQETARAVETAYNARGMMGAPLFFEDDDE